VVAEGNTIKAQSLFQEARAEEVLENMQVQHILVHKEKMVLAVEVEDEVEQQVLVKGEVMA